MSKKSQNFHFPQKTGPDCKWASAIFVSSMDDTTAPTEQNIFWTLTNNFQKFSTNNMKENLKKSANF